MSPIGAHPTHSGETERPVPPRILLDDGSTTLPSIIPPAQSLYAPSAARRGLGVFQRLLYTLVTQERFPDTFLDDLLDAAVYHLLEHSFGGTSVEGQLRSKLETFMSSGGKRILGPTAALDGETGEFGLEGVSVAYEGRPRHCRATCGSTRRSRTRPSSSQTTCSITGRIWLVRWKAPRCTGNCVAPSSTGRGSI